VKTQGSFIVAGDVTSPLNCSLQVKRVLGRCDSRGDKNVMRTRFLFFHVILHSLFCFSLFA